MKNIVFFCQLAALLAVSYGQLHNSPGGPPVETTDLLRRREELIRRQQVTGASRPTPASQRSQDTRQLSQIRDELQRSEELIRVEMLRLRQLQLQQASLSQQFRPNTGGIPQSSPFVTQQVSRESIPPPPPQVEVPQMVRDHIPQAPQVGVSQAPRRVIPQAPPVVAPQAPRRVNPHQAPQVVVPQPPREVPPPPRHQVGTPARLREAVDNAEEALFRKQAENAHYTFNSSVNDGIYDNSQFREETRDGLNVQGLYAYSDGFYRRTVHYVADENGYRVVKETAEPIGEGPLINIRGSADISSVISGIGNQYQITTADIAAFNLPPRPQERS